MEAVSVTVRGADADRLAEAFVASKARETRSLNKRGVRNIHRYEGEGFTKVTYERAAAFEKSWVMVSLVVEFVDERTSTVVLCVGGGGEGPFKLEELSLRRLTKGEEEVGQAGRFATVLEDLRDVCDSLDLSVSVEWETETETRTARKITRKILEK